MYESRKTQIPTSTVDIRLYIYAPDGRTCCEVYLVPYRIKSTIIIIVQWQVGILDEMNKAYRECKSSRRGPGKSPTLSPPLAAFCKASNAAVLRESLCYYKLILPSSSYLGITSSTVAAVTHRLLIPVRCSPLCRCTPGPKLYTRHPCVNRAHRPNRR